MGFDKELAIGIALRVALFAACLALVSWIALTDYKKATMKAYADSLELARSDARIIEALGSRIIRDWFIKGPVQDEDNPSDVRFEYSLVGTKGRATIRARAAASPDRPALRSLSAELKTTGEVVYLVP